MVPTAMRSTFTGTPVKNSVLFLQRNHSTMMNLTVAVFTSKMLRMHRTVSAALL